MSNPIRGIPPSDICKAYKDRNLARLSDAELFSNIVDILHYPRYKIDSFILHAPLELISRFALLNFLPPNRRELARLQMIALGACYESKEGEVRSLSPPKNITSPNQIFEILYKAVSEGDIDMADSAGAWIGEHIDAGIFAKQALNILLDYVGAAAHGPIFVALLTRVGPILERKAMAMTRVFTRQLAKEYQRKLMTPKLEVASEINPSEEIVKDLFWESMKGIAPAPLEGGVGVWSIINNVETSGVARDLLAQAWAMATPNNWEAAIHGIAKAAAYSMLQDTDAHAKYGWSHCLSIPHGLWVSARFTDDKMGIIRQASIIGTGFRRAHGIKQLYEDLELPIVTMPLDEALKVGPIEAAAVAFYARGREAANVSTTLATAASIRNDAHLVKYVLTCLDAGGLLPAAEPLFRAAAAYLVAIWVLETHEDEITSNLTVGRLLD